MNAQHLVGLIAAAKADRLTYERVWADCYRMTFPIMGAGIDNQVTAASAELQARREQATRIYDSTAAEAIRYLASFIVSGLTPSNARWFDLLPPGMSDDVEGASAWYDEVADLIWREIHAGNYDATAVETMIDWLVAGWVCTHQALSDAGEYRFTRWPVSSVYYAQSRSDGPVDIVMRRYMLTPMQAVTEFDQPGDQLPQDVRDQANTPKANSDPREYWHVITPRKGAKPSDFGKSMPIASYHLDMKTAGLIRESGYPEMPVALPRYMTIPGSPYAVGLMYEALPTCLTLNEAQRLSLQNAEMAIAGMWIAEDDGVINPRTIKIGPRQVVVANSVDSIKPLSPGGRFDLGLIQIENLQETLKSVLMTNRLSLPDTSGMTAYEASARMDMIRSLIAPIIGRLQSEFLQTTIVRCFGELSRAGRIPKPPEAISGSIEIVYTSPLARLQRASDIAQINTAETEIVNLSAAQPDILDVFDFDAAEREKNKLRGIPATIIRDKRAVDAIRKARGEAAQAQMEAEQAAAGQETSALASALQGI